MYRSFLPSLLIAAGVALGACGGTTSGNGGNGNNPPVQASAFATSYAHAICDNVASCCQTNGLAYDANNCLTSAQGIVQGLLVNPAVAAGATYDASAAGDCVAAIKAAVTACSDDMATQNKLDAACKGVYSGTKKPGETCTSDYDCAASSDGAVSCIMWSNGGSNGTTNQGSLCQVRKVAQGGEPCSGSSSGAPPAVIGACSFGESDTFTCDFTSNTCKPRGAVGASCDFSADCVASAFCDAGKCAARYTQGSACHPAGDQCSQDTQCDGTTALCAPKLGPGAACTTGAACKSGDCSMGKCRSSTFADPSVCGGGPAGH